MPTEIRQIDDPETGRVVLRIDGEMLREDAELLEKIARGLLTSESKVVIDLADLDLLDSEAASVLRRLGSANGVSIEGVEVLVQSAIDGAERHGPEKA